MGSLGYKLYENDIACDVKESFLKYLQEYKFDCEKATKQIVLEYREELEDVDDAPFIWLALADTQWNKGLLLDYVKENALKFIDAEINADQQIKWQKDHNKRKEHLIKLKEKILSEKSPATKPRVKKNFICDWKIGDTFAYKLASEYSLEKGLFNRYLIFHKIAEVNGYPAEIFPVVFVKLTRDDKIPSSKEEIDALEFVQISTVSEWHRGRTDVFNPVEIQREIAKNSPIVSERDDLGYIPNYRIALSFTSKRNIPKEMVYLGNFDLMPPRINYKYEKVQQILWKFAEKIIIDRYVAFNLRESPLYNNRIFGSE